MRLIFSLLLLALSFVQFNDEFSAYELLDYFCIGKQLLRPVRLQMQLLLERRFCLRLIGVVSVSSELSFHL